MQWCGLMSASFLAVVCMGNWANFNAISGLVGANNPNISVVNWACLIDFFGQISQGDNTPIVLGVKITKIFK